jgi:hypothetical protein
VGAPPHDRKRRGLTMCMNETKTVCLVQDLLDNAEVVQVYDESLWIKVDRDAYDALVEFMYPSVGEGA